MGLASMLDDIGGKAGARILEKELKLSKNSAKVGAKAAEKAVTYSGALEGAVIGAGGGAITGGAIAAFDGDENTTVLGGAIKGGLIGGAVGGVAGGEIGRRTGNGRLFEAMKGGPMTGSELVIAQNLSSGRKANGGNIDPLGIAQKDVIYGAGPTVETLSGSIASGPSAGAGLVPVSGEGFAMGSGVSSTIPKGTGSKLRSYAQGVRKDVDTLSRKMDGNPQFHQSLMEDFMTNSENRAINLERNIGNDTMNMLYGI